MTATKKAPRPALAPGDRWCSQHHRPLSECDPSQAHVYSVRLRKDLVERIEAAGAGDLSDFLRQAAVWAVTGAEAGGPDSGLDAARAAAAEARAELAEVKRRVRIAQGQLRSILDGSEDGPEQAAPGSVKFRSPDANGAPR